MSDAGSEDFDEEEQLEEVGGVEEDQLEEAEGVEEDDKNNLIENSFTQEMVPECLSMLCKIGNGLAHAYVRMDCHEKGLTDINHIQNFIHVRYVDVSGNLLTDLSPLNHLPYLLSLKANNNNLTTGKIEMKPFLQILDLSGNRLTEVEGFDHPQLARLNLNQNVIRDVEGLNPDRLTNLHTLELRGNKLESISSLKLSNIENLFLAANLLKNLEGIVNMKNLKYLHVRDNQIETLSGFDKSLEKLEYINIRGNDVKSLKEVENLVCLPNLKVFLLTDNPCVEEDTYRIEVLAMLKQLKRIDKEEVSADEREEAQDYILSKEEENEANNNEGSEN